MKMPLQLCDVEFSDGPAIAEVSMNAFYNDPMQKALFPGMTKAHRIEGLNQRWPQNYGSLNKHYKKVIDVDSGQVVSYSCWRFVNTYIGGTKARTNGTRQNVWT